jgi:hypothetical protein
VKTVLAIIGVLAGATLGAGIGLWITTVATGSGGEEHLLTSVARWRRSEYRLAFIRTDR